MYFLSLAKSTKLKDVTRFPVGYVSIAFWRDKKKVFRSTQTHAGTEKNIGFVTYKKCYFFRIYCEIIWLLAELDVCCIIHNFPKIIINKKTWEIFFGFFSGDYHKIYIIFGGYKVSERERLFKTRWKVYLLRGRCVDVSASSAWGLCNASDEASNQGGLSAWTGWLINAVS